MRQLDCAWSCTREVRGARALPKHLSCSRPRLSCCTPPYFLPWSMLATWLVVNTLPPPAYNIGHRSQHCSCYSSALFQPERARCFAATLPWLNITGSKYMFILCRGAYCGTLCGDLHPGALLKPPIAAHGILRLFVCLLQAVLQ